jgi:hypothetical protein
MRMWFNYMDKTGQNLITGFNYEKTPGKTHAVSE